MYMLAILCLVSAAVALPVEKLNPPPNLEGKRPIEDHGGKIESIPYVDKSHGPLKEPKELELQGAKELPQLDDSKKLDKPKEFNKVEDSKEPKKDDEFKDPKKDADFKEPKKDADFKEPKKDADFKEPKKDADFKEPKKDADYKEPKKDAEFKEPKKDNDFKEPKKDDDFKEPKKDDGIKDEHKNPAPESEKDIGYDKYPVIDPKKPSRLSGILNWIFNLLPFNPFSSSNGTRSDFDDQPIIEYQVEPSDPDALNLLK